MDQINQAADSPVVHSIADFIRNIDLSSYTEILNPTTWQAANLESFIVMFLILAICYKTFHKAYKFAGWCLGLLLLVQICYTLGQSSLNNIIPFSSIFKYDVGVSFANFFAGTKIAEWILWIHDLMHNGIMMLGNYIAQYLPMIGEKAEELRDSIEIPQA